MERAYATAANFETSTCQTQETLMTKVRHTLGKYATALSGVFIAKNEAAASAQGRSVAETRYTDMPVCIDELAEMSRERNDPIRETAVSYITRQQIHLAVESPIF